MTLPSDYSYTRDIQSGMMNPNAAPSSVWGQEGARLANLAAAAESAANRARCDTAYDVAPSSSGGWCESLAMPAPVEESREFSRDRNSLHQLIGDMTAYVVRDDGKFDRDMADKIVRLKGYEIACSELRQIRVYGTGNYDF